MYDLKPTSVHMLDGVRDDPDALARVERMTAALGWSLDDVRVFAPEDACDVARELQAWPSADLLIDVPREHQRPLVFTSLACDRPQEDDPILAARPDDIPQTMLADILGYIDPVRSYHTYEKDAEENMVCWPTRDFGVMSGCSHGCHYCGAGKHGKCLALGANVEEYVERVVGPTIEETPQQRCFRMIGWGADIISMEPEYHVFEPYLAKLAEHDRFGYFHSNSDNVDWIAGLPSRERLIGVWSMACDAMADRIEPGSPSPDARIEAARKCNEWGIPVRFKFKPTIPVRNWREEYASLIERIFAKTEPETIGFCVIMWMAIENLKKQIDPELLDPEYLRRAEEAAEEMASVKTGPFPHEVRAEIYRFLIGEVRKWDGDVPIFISTESREMWVELEDELGQNARSFMCGCNPVQVPGPKMRLSEQIGHSTWFEPSPVS